MIPWKIPSYWKMGLMLFLMTWSIGKMEPRWGILSAYPKPMPVRHNAAVFPRFFTTSKELGLPSLPLDKQIAPLGEDRKFQEEGSLCFVLTDVDPDNEPCLAFKKQGLAWFKNEYDLRNLTDGDITCNANQTQCYYLTHTEVLEKAVWLNGTFLSSKDNLSDSEMPPVQQRFAPHCWHTYEQEVWPWSDCQSTVVAWADASKSFTFSPDMRGPKRGRLMYNQGLFIQNPLMKPYDKWILCGVNGSCTELNAFSLLQGGTTGFSSFLGTFVHNSTMRLLISKEEGNATIFEPQGPPTGGYKTIVEHFHNHTYPPAPVCVYSPFLFILSNSSFGKCTNQTCFLSQCWDAEQFTRALVARVPRWIPVPVEAPSTMTLFRPKRDFGITAAVIVAISAAATAATVAGIAMSTTVQTASTLNSISQTVARALDSQAVIDTRLRGGILIVNQRIDLVQEQLDMTWQLAQLGCEWKFNALCITSVPYDNYTRAANLSRSLSLYLAGNWSQDFDALLGQLRQAVLVINSTRVDLSLAEGMTSWISSAVSLFKEWVGVGMFGCVLAAGIILALFLLCRISRRRKVEKMAIAKALAALDAGSSPKAWIAVLRDA
ncbi:uncharacterized protein LOC131900446 [Peromyscus eremicus]|uniref:uncharacterized protein LOC131900446 n=1 Tax=Peromyscus eremicus TaxID=42410 RepID=UPI0027DB960C|nr:uncharacterized protein LOC131900446 [Peromyscus eremicus]